jgi:hypothetical protein
VASPWGNPQPHDRKSETGKWLGVKGVLPEAAFRRMLLFERSRSDRTQRMFALLLLNMGRLLVNDNDAEALPVILSLLQSTTREIDVLGWNETNTSVGVMLPEIALDNDLPVKAILSRISVALQHKLTAHQFNQIRFSCQLYPDSSGQTIYASGENSVQLPRLQETVAWTTRESGAETIKVLKRQESSTG